MIKITRMRSDIGRRAFIVVENFTWCERKYLQWFRGYKHKRETRRNRANVPQFGTKITYVDKINFLWKQGAYKGDLKKELK